MARQPAVTATAAPLGFFERYLTLWVALCIFGGTLLGLFAPAAAQAVGALEIAQVNIPVGLLIWVMIIPMLMKIDFGSLGEVYQQRAGMAVTLAVNWLIKPFTMAFLAWLFLRQLFAQWLPAEQIDSYVVPDGSVLRLPITAYAGTADTHITPSRILAWERWALPGFACRSFEGDHFYLNHQRGALIDDLLARWSNGEAPPVRERA